MQLGLSHRITFANTWEFPRLLPMKQDRPAEPEDICGFGGAQLLRHVDRRDVREWLAKFMPDVLAALPGK
jgi:hypothetical protein